MEKRRNAQDRFVERIGGYIDSVIRLDKTRLQLVALSGGADSVALLVAMMRLGYRVEAMHCNFNLRGEESLRDENFCKGLADRLGIALHIAHFDTKTYCALHHVSVEMGARDLRYNYFRQLREDTGAESILVAHHKDDCAETVLLNLVRGTGISGMAGIRPRNGYVCRPMLCVNRAEIVGFLDRNGQSYVTDSSNLVADVKRNKIRLEVMPLLKQLNPSVVDALVNSAQHVSEAIPLVRQSVERNLGDVAVKDGETMTISIRRLAEKDSPAYLLYEALSPYGFSSATIGQIYGNLGAQTGKTWMAGDYVAVIDRENIVVEKKAADFSPMPLPIEGRYVIGGKQTLSIVRREVSEGFVIDRNPATATLDAGKVKFPLTLRRVRKDDRFTPFGMKGTKLVSDFLTDRKLSLVSKQRQLCLADATGTIVWIVGQRINDRYKMTADTINALIVRYMPE